MSFFVTMSPAKRFEAIPTPDNFSPTEPYFKLQSDVLATMMATLSSDELADLMGISAQLAALNYDRYQKFQLLDTDGYLPAIYGFAGDAFKALDAKTLPFPSLMHMQSHVGILSGLYGLLRPFDRIQPYRLEMGTATQNIMDSSLYDYWRVQLTQYLQQCIIQVNADYHINLASQEYSQAIDQQALHVPTVTMVFAKPHGDSFKVVGINAKRMRGTMVRYIVTHNPRDIDDLKDFSEHGYRFSQKHSTLTSYVYLCDG